MSRNKIKVNIGDTIIAEDGKKYFFIYDEFEPYAPFCQVDIKTYQVVDRYPIKLFHELNKGFNLPIGGKIIKIKKK